MKGLIITSKGIEETACIEVKDLINVDCKSEEGCVVFEFKDFKDLCLLCYKSQSADRVLCMIGNFEFKDFFEELKRFIEKTDFGDWATKYKDFKVECIRVGNHDFNSVDVESKTAGLLLSRYKKIKVDIKNYKVIFLAYIVNNKCYFGVDFAGFELNKRAYKIFLHPNSLRGTIAYALVRESGFDKGDVMLDPFSRDGVIAIEAAFYASGFPNNYYKKDRFAFVKLDLGIDSDKFFRYVDKKIKKPKAEIYSFDHLFKYVDYSKKNAKIAGVDKFVNFSRTELEWLDIKFKKKSVDRIITNPPTSKNANLGKIYNEFFYQIEYILKDDGAIALITRMPEFVKKHAEKHNFVVQKEKEVYSGEQLLKIMLLKKKNI
ncbi:MAG: THUMP domain-containing protein [Nanoarchaeota archaeon]|nr:THUMP domain-containing protein [Nanoarchaeota archaeon]